MTTRLRWKEVNPFTTDRPKGSLHCIVYTKCRVVTNNAVKFTSQYIDYKYYVIFYLGGFYNSYTGLILFVCYIGCIHRVSKLRLWCQEGDCGSERVKPQCAHTASSAKSGQHSYSVEEAGGREEKKIEAAQHGEPF